MKDEDWERYFMELADERLGVGDDWDSPLRSSLGPSPYRRLNPVKVVVGLTLLGGAILLVPLFYTVIRFIWRI